MSVGKNNTGKCVFSLIQNVQNSVPRNNFLSDMVLWYLFSILIAVITAMIMFHFYYYLNDLKNFVEK